MSVNNATIYKEQNVLLCDHFVIFFGVKRFFCFSVVTCDKPAIANGNTSWDSEDDPEYNNIIRYTCHEGYTLIGSDTVVCDEYGDYSPDQPVCNGKADASVCFTCYF